jgi:glyoxylase-like metal-dependent hydrolase (beta-lactamase superfamily II)
MSKTGVRWSVLTIGHLSRNRFWGEDDGTARRTPLCTSALVWAGRDVIVVDPPLPPGEMPGLLDRRAGLAIGDVTRVYLTHFHGDHRAGMEAFADVPWLMPDAEWVYWDRRLAPDAPERRLLGRIETVAAEGSAIWQGVTTLHLPGHTPGLAGLVFDDRDDRRVVIASDAAMTRDFFDARVGYFNSDDLDMARKSIDRLRVTADVILPGHDNYFWNNRIGMAEQGES